MMTATWFVPDDQSGLNYYVCQSPKVSRSQVSTPSPYDTTPIPPTDGNCMQGYDDVIPSSSKCYLMKTIDRPISWNDASSLCEKTMNWNYDVDYSAINTQLVSIDSDEENDLLFDYMTSYNIPSAWIGLTWTCKLITFKTKKELFIAVQNNMQLISNYNLLYI